MEMIPFTYQDSPVRTIENDGRVLFCGKDVAVALGYKDPTNALKQHCRGVAKHHPIVDVLGRTQDARFITEGDLYRLVASSKLPTAQNFESWVFDEVLPSIRKRGGYLTPEATAEALTDPDFIIRLATDLKAERAKRAQLEEARKAERPKVLFADSVATSDSTILVGDLAKILKGNGMEIGANRLFARLREDGFLIKRKGADWNMPTQRAMELGLFKIKESSHIHSDGHVTISKTPKVTGNGQTYLVNHYLKEMEK